MTEDDPRSSLPSAHQTIIDDLQTHHGYSTINATQRLAFENGALDPGNHLLVAETGNGKTFTAEANVKRVLNDGGRVAYLVPSRQLLRAKTATISAWATETVTVSAGQGKYSHADVAVATFSAFFRAILNGTGSARQFDLAILDDFHELYGSFNGAAIEKAVAAAKYYEIEVYGMSATLGNPAELAAWLNADLTVSPTDRAVPIEESVVPVGTVPKKQQLARFLETHADHAPFLVFNYTKPWTETRADAIADTRAFADAPNPERDYYTTLAGKVDGEMTETLISLARMIQRGVAFHHADLPREVKSWIEDLFHNGEIQCLCATTTIAYGFDSPVQSVVVADITRGPDYVGVWEYVQWIGRAARPGFGYETGYAYTFSDDPEPTRQQFFAPHRDLERITTHVEGETAFRWLLLELIATNWDTPHEIEAFVKETLYWEQMQSLGAWGQDFASKDEQLNERLRETADWLIEHGFITERTITRGFTPTALGEAAVNFAADTFVSVPLARIRTFSDWLEDEERTHGSLQTIDAVVRLADRTLRSQGASAALEGYLQEREIAVDAAGITAGVIRRYWMHNFDLQQITAEAGVDATYLASTARRIAQTFVATKHFYTASPTTRCPDWFDDTALRIERGIRHEEVPLVNNVAGVGRGRVRSLTQYLAGDAATVQDLSGETLMEQLLALTDRYEPTQVKAILQTPDHIGGKTATNIVEFITTATIDDRYTTAPQTNQSQPPDAETAADEPETDTQSGFTRATRLDEFM